MSKERIVGIDFGTSTSVVRVKEYGENGKPIGDELFTRSVTFNYGASMVPSVIRMVNDSYAYGYDAEVPARNAEYFRSFKIGLQSKDKNEKEHSKQLVNQFFKYIYNEYNHQLVTGNIGDINSDTKTIISYPVKWDPDLESFMIDAAKSAGFENVSGMDEAEAAIRAVTVQCKDMINKSGLLENGKPSNIMLIDMGAGTTDIVICKCTPGNDMKNEIITTWPKGGNILFGGQEIDNILRDFLVSRFPQEYREKAEKRLSVDKIKAWKENTVSKVLEDNKIITESYEAYDVAETLDVDYEAFTLDRKNFEMLFHDYIEQFVQLVSGAVKDSGLQPGEIDLVILTGGHSKWYFAKELLLDKNERFEHLGLEKIKAQPERILSVALPQETVALGLVYSKISGAVSFDKKKRYEDIYDAQKSIPALEEAAKLDSPKAINELGYYYATGGGNFSKDTEKAEQLYMKASKMGYEISWYNLGCLYFEKKEYAEALNAFTKAADKNIPEAVFNLAVCYHYGLGAAKNEDRALELYQKSYDLGYSDAKESFESLSNIRSIQEHPYDPVWYAQMLEKDLTSKGIKFDNLYIGEENIGKSNMDRIILEDAEKLVLYYDEVGRDRYESHFWYLTDKFLGSGRICSNGKTVLGRCTFGCISSIEPSDPWTIRGVKVTEIDNKQRGVFSCNYPEEMAEFLSKVINYIKEKSN